MPNQPTEPISTAPAELGQADSMGLGNATREELMQIVSELRLSLAQQRQGFEDERALLMCQAYEAGALDERSGRLPRR